MGFKIIKEINSECLGAMYMDLVHIASKKFLSADALHSFCNELWDKLYGTSYDEKLYICIGESYNDESHYFFNELDKDLDESLWYCMLYEDEEPHLYQIRIGE